MKLPNDLTHLLAIDGDHIIVHPIMNHVIPLGSHGLRDLAFMVRGRSSPCHPVDVECSPRYFLPIAVHSQCQPGSRRSTETVQRMICSGWAHFQRAKSMALCFSSCRPTHGSYSTYPRYCDPRGCRIYDLYYISLRRNRRSLGFRKRCRYPESS